MTGVAEAAHLIERLPLKAAGSTALYVLDGNGRVLLHRGHDDHLPTRVHRVWLEDGLGDARAWCCRPMGHDGLQLLVIFDSEPGPGPDFLIDALARMAGEWLSLESEVECMSPTSLALLEEVAMVHEVMTRLPECRTMAEVARLALEELMIAADVERGYYLSFDVDRGDGEVLVALQMPFGQRRPSVDEAGLRRRVETASGTVGRLSATSGGASIEVVGVAPLGDHGSPESTARRELLSVPVLGSGEDSSRVIGALLICDKRDTARAFGSQECKMASNVAAMVGAALGNRRVASLSKELELASEIQRQILPAVPARVPGFDLAGRCDTSGAVGGDYFDFLPMADGRTLALVADVSGHNLASGMVMVGARSSLRLLASRLEDPAEVFDGLLDAMFDDLQRTELFVTAAGVSIQPDDGRLALVNAGHHDLVVCRAADGAIERFSSRGAVLGFLGLEEYGSVPVELQHGDVALLFTDGLVEAQDHGERMFGEDRLDAALSAARHGTAAEMLGAIFEACAEFSAAGQIDDDRSAIVIKRIGEP